MPQCAPGSPAVRRSCAWPRLWALALCLALCSPLWALDSDTDASSTISASELSRLVEISTRLARLNETLRTELEDSRKSSAELARTLESSRVELEDLRRILRELERTAQSSARELDGLRTALKRAEDSLQSLESSFAAYRAEATREIRDLKAAKGFFGWLTGIFAALAVSGWAAFILVLIF